jgi:hypothetical protein
MKNTIYFDPRRDFLSRSVKLLTHAAAKEIGPANARSTAVGDEGHEHPE